jgi:hypothetical protein
MVMREENFGFIWKSLQIASVQFQNHFFEIEFASKSFVIVDGF